MKAAALLDLMIAQGIQITAKGSRLTIEAPAGILTDDDRTVLAEHKADLLALLLPLATPATEPLPWRAALATASIPLRERWGHRSNALEDAGLTWRDAERQAALELGLIPQEIARAS